MKLRKCRILALVGVMMLGVSTSLSGCMMTSTTETENAAETASYPLSVGDTAQIKDPGDGYTLLDIQDSLTARGLYYAAWGVGEAEDYSDDDKTIKLYDAQIYMIISTCTEESEAIETVGEWESTARGSYDVTEESEVTYQLNDTSLDMTMISYTYPEDLDNPCDYGMSVYGTDGTTAICVEISCRNQWDGDGEKLIETFLNLCQGL